MAPVTPVFPSLRVDRIDLYQGDRQQQSPFKNGAILRGQITGRQGNRFVLDVDGQQWVASSKTPLRVGQNLNLKVTGTSPSVTLQILADHLTSQVGKSLHLLAEEGNLVVRTIELASLIPQEDLSPASRQTLAFFQNSTELLTGTDQAGQGVSSRYGEQLADLVRQAFDGQEQSTRQGLRDLLQSIIRDLPEHGKTAKQAHSLLATLTDSAEGNTLRSLLFSTGRDNETGPPPDTQLRQLALSGPAGQSLAEALQLVRADRDSVLPTPFLLRLLGLVVNLETDTEQHGPRIPAGGQGLKHLIDRIGTNLERLLAEGKTDHAAATLKSALLDIRKQLNGNKEISSQAGHLSSTIEAIQMLQVRLAQDAIFLLPLPFPFLEQGFLVVDRDRAGEQENTRKQDGNRQRYSLYLQLAGLGNLRIDLHPGDSGTRILFYAQDSERARFLSQYRAELLDMLTATTPESIQFLTGAEDPLGTLLAQITDSSASLLSTTA